MKYPREENLDSKCWTLDDCIEIQALPGQIWPWLAQMGNGRAGWYSYDLIDNLGKKSFEHIDHELVKITKGQKIPFATISEIEPDKLITYKFGSKASMSYLLEPLNQNSTRLWTRLRYQNAGKITKWLLKPAHIFMQNKQFLEIKKRAESNR